VKKEAQDRYRSLVGDDQVHHVAAGSVLEIVRHGTGLAAAAIRSCHGGQSNRKKRHSLTNATLLKREGGM
jgi:hypothetical protein